MSLVKKALAKAAAQKQAQQEADNKAAPVNSTPAPDSPAQDKQVVADDGPSRYEFFKAAIESDLGQLKTIDDVADKASYKSEALERNEYLAYISEYRLSGQNFPNTVLAWVFIWLVDLKRWDAVLELLPLMVEQKQPLPTAFNTKHWPTFLIDQLYDEGNYYLNKGAEAVSDSGIALVMHRLIAQLLTQDWSGSEVVGGKLYAMAAKLEQSQHNLGYALQFAVQATLINDGAGVKKLARDVAKQLNVSIDI